MKILGRSPEALKKRYPEAEYIKGSMLNGYDSVMKNFCAAFLNTPIGSRNNMQNEINAAKAFIEVAKEVELANLIIVSVLCTLLYSRKDRLSSIIPIIKFFNSCGYRGNTTQMCKEFLEFKMTSLEEYLMCYKLNDLFWDSYIPQT